MKHSSVKGKTIPMWKTLVAGAAYVEAEKRFFRSKLGATSNYYGILNDIVFEQQGDNLIVSAEKMVLFLFPGDIVTELSSRSESFTSEIKEEINRVKYTFFGFKMIYPINLGVLEPAVPVMVTFRAGGDYVCTNEEGEKSYGPNLTAANFNDKGFSIETAKGIEYIYTERES